MRPFMLVLIQGLLVPALTLMISLSLSFILGTCVT